MTQESDAEDGIINEKDEMIPEKDTIAGKLSTENARLRAELEMICK